MYNPPHNKRHTMFSWLRKRRREAILEQPFPQSWRTILTEQVTHYSFLNDREKTALEQLTQVFAAEKNFEGCGGFVLSDEARVIISAQASMLVLNLPHDLYRKVDSVLIYPSTVLSSSVSSGVFTGRTGVVETVPILGEAHMNGPVILVWDAVKHGAIHPETGHNVVYHEFAHKLDMLDGEADGFPVLHEREQYDEWAKICSKEYQALSGKLERGAKTFLDPYGATNAAEFFAVVTEYFFDKPISLKQKHPSLYEIMEQFYRQDTAARQKKHLVESR